MNQELNQITKRTDLQPDVIIVSKNDNEQSYVGPDEVFVKIPRMIFTGGLKPEAVALLAYLWSAQTSTFWPAIFWPEEIYRDLGIHVIHLRQLFKDLERQGLVVFESHKKTHNIQWTITLNCPQNRM